MAIAALRFEMCAALAQVAAPAHRPKVVAGPHNRLIQLFQMLDVDEALIDPVQVNQVVVSAHPFQHKCGHARMPERELEAHRFIAFVKELKQLFTGVQTGFYHTVQQAKLRVAKVLVLSGVNQVFCNDAFCMRGGNQVFGEDISAAAVAGTQMQDLKRGFHARKLQQKFYR